MKRRFLVVLFAALSLAGQSQDTVWQELNESLPEGTRIMPFRCSDNTHETDGLAQHTQDGDITTIYHTQYRGRIFKVSPENPAELVFDFKKVKRIDYLEYIPRQIGTNGIISDVEIYVKTAKDKDYRLYEHCQWTFDNTAKRVVFQGGLLKPQSIKVRFLKGYGNFASCAELKFMREEEMSYDTNLFADDLLTTLKPGTTQADVDGIRQPLLRHLAQELLQGTYSTDYRVASYECYNSPFWLSKEWHTPNKFYDQLQGVTGIVMEPGKHMLVVSGVPDSVNLCLNIMAWYTGKTLQDAPVDLCMCKPVRLQNGINIVNYDLQWEGLAYISYFSDGYADSNPPIRVHFVGGTVNGYLTPDMTNEQMHQMTASAPGRFIDAVSRKVHTVWTAAGMHEHCKADDGKSPGYRQYMNILDTLMTWEQRLVGLEKYGRIPRNRTLFYVNFSFSGLYQSSLGISTHVDSEPKYLNCKTILYDDPDAVWGMSHEWGHLHQLMLNFCWMGLMEVSNNLNSYYNHMHMGYKYEQLDKSKREGIEEGIRHYLEDENDDCLFEIKHVYDHAFERLGPFVRLCNYFMNEGGKPDYLPDLYEALRHTEVEPESTNMVPYVLNFIRAASAVSGYNLQPYFERFGFLRVKTFEINDYTKYYYQLTQEELDAFSKEMDSLTRKENLKVMPAGMIERIVKTPDIEYKRPYFAN